MPKRRIGEAGRQLAELRDGQHGEEKARDWQEDLPRERAEERREERRQERGETG